MTIRFAFFFAFTLMAFAAKGEMPPVSYPAPVPVIQPEPPDEPTPYFPGQIPRPRPEVATATPTPTPSSTANPDRQNSSQVATAPATTGSTMAAVTCDMIEDMVRSSDHAMVMMGQYLRTTSGIRCP